MSAPDSLGERLHEVTPGTPTPVSSQNIRPSSTLNRRTSFVLDHHGTFNVTRNWSDNWRSRRCGKARAYLRDLFVTTVHQPWYRLLFCAGVAYVASWLFYALVGMVFFDYQECIAGHNGDFADWYYWTCETMSTVGYGYLRPTCVGTKLLVGVMVLHSILLNSIVVGFIFTKFSSAANRATTVLISDVLCGTLVGESPIGHESFLDTLHMQSTQPENRFSGQPNPSLDQDGIYLSFRLVNARRHPLYRPQIEIYIMDHGPALAGEVPPVFHRLSFDVQPPLAFLEYPCTVTCWHPAPCPTTSIPTSSPGVHSRPVGNGMSRNPLDDLWLVPESERDAVLERLSVVVIFSAEEPAHGRNFEVRRTWPLKDVAWGKRFATMLSTNNDARGSPLEMVRMPGRTRARVPGEMTQPLLDFSRLNTVERAGR